MTNYFAREALDLISEFLTFIWLVLAFFLTAIVVLGQKIQMLTMPPFRTLNMGQKTREDGATEAEDLGSTGFLSRKIVVERVKNVFGKTLKPKEKLSEEEFDIRKVIRLFQSNSPKKSVTFADRDEVITMGCETLADFETGTSFFGEEKEDVEVKNLLFHEVDENFKPQMKGSAELWQRYKSDAMTVAIRKKLQSEPPPLPPRISQKMGSKVRPSVPPPLPPKAVTDGKPPVVRRDLKKSKVHHQNVSEIVDNFIQIQEIVNAEKPYESQETDEEKREEDVCELVKHEPVFFGEVTPSQDYSISPTFTTFKPELPKSDWKEEFFQPLNKSLICPSKLKVYSKSSKIPKIVEEIMEKAAEKKLETRINYDSLKKCKVNVSTLVSNFEQIRKESESNSYRGNIYATDSCVKNSVASIRDKIEKVMEPEIKRLSLDLQKKEVVASPKDRPMNRPLCVPIPFGAPSAYQPLKKTFPSDTNAMEHTERKQKVFFRAGALAQLESQRDEKLADLIIRFQSRCRGYLARKKLAKLKVQDLAVRCIQKNVRKLMQVREWPWWRLYVKVTPLLNVHRTEEELTAKLQELETLKSKVEKLEVERNQLKIENDLLETKLNEINADLSEERATGTLQAERLEAETAERIRLEQELSQVQQEKKNLLQTSERLEMELFYARADVNGLCEGEGDLDDGGGDAAMYKHKCDRALRELEFTRRRLQQQHEDDLEQLVALKKQLEKKLADAYEEVEEQRQVAGQWKRKVQKFQSEMNDLRLLLEEQTSRNNLLEKKQRKFDSEIQLLQDEIRSEKNQKDRLSREKEMAYAEKYSMEQNLSSVRLELELKEEKLETLTREVDELTRGGGSEQEVTQLRKAKHDLELKLKEEEEELDELAGQVSMLESTKLRLEMSLESLRKELRREMSQREDELDEVRSNSQKKLKALEAQLENEHEERTLLLREKHELERRLNDAEERGRHHRAADEDALVRLRRDLKKTKALLRDAQMMLERAKQDSPSKAALRALKNQLEDVELARASAAKAKQSLESELSEVNGQLEETIRAKGDVENRYQAVQRECNALRIQVDENEEELAELLKKYRQTVQQLSAEQLAGQETAGALAEAEAERASLRDQLAELTAKLEASTMLSPVSGMTQKRLEIRIKELESRLELEQTTRSRLEVQIARLKENMERMTEECIQLRNKEQMANDQTRKLQRALREAKEELAQQQAKEQEVAHKKRELEKRLETAEQEAMTARTDLRLAVKRIEDLQIAMSGEIASDSDRSESEAEDSGDESLMLHLQNSVSSSRSSKTPDLSPR